MKKKTICIMSIIAVACIFAWIIFRNNTSEANDMGDASLEENYAEVYSDGFLDSC